MTAAAEKDTVTPLFEGSEWTFDTLERTYRAIEEVALEDLGLDVYPNQIEVISSEQMLDAYSSIGMPTMYPHWSFGKHFAREERAYLKGYTALAYEIVINSNPCISYNMEENSMPIQTLVMAHAAFGHNHFFKNNELFQQWTDAEGILEYLQFAKGFIAHCEERYGADAVEEILDAAHALMDQGVFRYRRPPKLSVAEQKTRERLRHEHEESMVNDLWRTLPQGSDQQSDSESEKEAEEQRKLLKLPEENLLYFLQKNSPRLKTWEREILRIVHNIAQYFYPQKQTKIMNEGCATFVHHYIANVLFDRGLLTEGAMLEILHSHSNVIYQAAFDDPRYRGVNPYAIGFAMMQDIKRICEDPTDEDREWFPEFAGSDDWRGTLKHAWANYRDESFIQQYLSPHLIRTFKLFVLRDEAAQSHFTVSDIHNEAGYKKVRDAFARSRDISMVEPNIEVVDVDLKGDRLLKLRHTKRSDVPLEESQSEEVLRHVKRLWGYDVSLESCSDAT